MNDGRVENPICSSLPGRGLEVGKGKNLYFTPCWKLGGVFLNYFAYGLWAGRDLWHRPPAVVTQVVVSPGKGPPSCVELGAGAAGCCVGSRSPRPPPAMCPWGWRSWQRVSPAGFCRLLPKMSSEEEIVRAGRWECRGGWGRAASGVSQRQTFFPLEDQRCCISPGWGEEGAEPGAFASNSPGKG